MPKDYIYSSIQSQHNLQKNYLKNLPTVLVTTPCSVPMAYIRDKTKTRIAKKTIKVLVPPLPKNLSAKATSPISLRRGQRYLSIKTAMIQPKIRTKYFINYYYSIHLKAFFAPISPNICSKSLTYPSRFI